MAMRYKKLSFLFLLLLLAVRSLAQTIVVSGVIRDAPTGQPLKNASILDRSRKRGTRSDSLGRFFLPVRAPDTRLELSMIGYGGKNNFPGNEYSGQNENKQEKEHKN